MLPFFEPFRILIIARSLSVSVILTAFTGAFLIITGFALVFGLTDFAFGFSAFPSATANFSVCFTSFVSSFLIARRSLIIIILVLLSCFLKLKNHSITTRYRKSLAVMAPNCLI